MDSRFCPCYNSYLVCVYWYLSASHAGGPRFEPARFHHIFSLSMRTGKLCAYIKRKSMQSLSLHQHSLLIENSNIPYLSPSGSAEILPATRKVMIVLTPLQRRDAYCMVRCAKCTVQAVRDARSITLYRDRLSRQSSGYVLWSCRGSRAIPLGCPGFMA